MRALSDRQRYVLDSLLVFGGGDDGEHERQWARPMDIGARDGSHHTETLRALIDRGLVERKLRGSLLNQIRGGEEAFAEWARVKRSRHAPRGSYVYRLTASGLDEARRWRKLFGRITNPDAGARA